MISHCSEWKIRLPYSGRRSAPPKDNNLGIGQFLDVSVRGKSTFLRDTRCRVVKWCCPPQDVQGTTLESIESRAVYIILILRPQDRTSVGKEHDTEQTANPTTTEIRNFCELTGEKSSNIPRTGTGSFPRQESFDKIWYRVLYSSSLASGPPR